jgi:putative nucleotidyltransferase with HDIG domain
MLAMRPYGVTGAMATQMVLKGAIELKDVLPFPAPRTLASNEALAADINHGESGWVRTALRALEAAFEGAFAVVDPVAGTVALPANVGIAWNFASKLELLREVVRRGQPEIIEDESPLAMLAVPLDGAGDGQPLAAVAVCLTAKVPSEREMASAARVFGVDVAAALRWSQTQEAWTPRMLLRMAAATIENVAHRSQLSHLQFQINDAVAHARDTYVELGLLHRLARTLGVTHDPARVLQRAVAWLADAIPAQCVAVVRNLDFTSQEIAGDCRPLACEPIQGHCPIDHDRLADLMHRLGEAAHRPMLFNRAQTSVASWGFPAVRELACAPIVHDGRIDGWLIAVNHTGHGADALCEFGSAEVRLLDSVGAILGVHHSNWSLFHRQGELFASSVKALTSAIDAKDPYTHGHSERVARVATCLAEQMGLDDDSLNTMYLGGLLHDIGKIGVDDFVLNKPGALTAEEFEQVKQHPQLGYEILRGVRQLDKILPIVLHHHEAWDGSGYPHRLVGDQTPLLARVAAVADAFDAMSSDRPYRKGLDENTLDRIFREGAGSQWDPQVVDAFFACRDRIRRLASDDSIGVVTLDPLHWVC